MGRLGAVVGRGRAGRRSADRYRVGLERGRAGAGALPRGGAVPPRRGAALGAGHRAPAVVGHAAFVVGTDGALWWATATLGWTSLGRAPAGHRRRPGRGVMGRRPHRRVRPRRRQPAMADLDHLRRLRMALAGPSRSASRRHPGVVAHRHQLGTGPPRRVRAGHRRAVLSAVLGHDRLERCLAGPGRSAGGRLRRPPPAAASWGPDRVDLFARGTDNRLWQSYWTGPAWTGWIQPPGTETGDAGIRAGGQPMGGTARIQLSVFVRGSDGHLYQTTWGDGAWAGWVGVGAPSD